MEMYLRSANEIMEILNKNMNYMRKEFSVRKIGVFGSYVKDSANSNSDIDILVEFKEKTFDNYMDLKFFLEDLFGKKVDLVISDTIKKRIRPSILRETQYV
jgi:uncharacterized protein